MDESELKDQELHDRKMARLAKESQYVRDLERKLADAVMREQSSEKLRTAAIANMNASARRVEELERALAASVEVIKTWHNMPGPVRLPDSVMEETWRIYYENAPEMKPIREALK